MSDSNKKISPDKKFYAESNGALLNVVSRENEAERFSLALNQYKSRKPEIFRWSQDSKAVGMFIARGIPFDAGGYMSVRTNYWIGIWYPFENEFFAVHFPNKTDLELHSEPIDSIEVLAEERTVIYSFKGKEFKRVEMPEKPMLSNWENEKRDLEIVETKPPDPNKKNGLGTKINTATKAFIFMKGRFYGSRIRIIRTAAAAQTGKVLKISSLTARRILSRLNFCRNSTLRLKS